MVRSVHKSLTALPNLQRPLSRVFAIARLALHGSRCAGQFLNGELKVDAETDQSSLQFDAYYALLLCASMLDCLCATSHSRSCYCDTCHEQHHAMKQLDQFF